MNPNTPPLGRDAVYENIATLQAFIDNPNVSDYNTSGFPIWITEGKCEDRTKLLLWIASELGNKYCEQNVRIMYFNAHDFEAITKSNDIIDFRTKYADIDFLLVDNAQFIASCPEFEEEFFKMYCHMTARNKPVIIAADAGFRAIGFNVRLMTRFAIGAEISF